MIYLLSGPAADTEALAIAIVKRHIPQAVVHPYHGAFRSAVDDLYYPLQNFLEEGIPIDVVQPEEATRRLAPFFFDVLGPSFLRAYNQAILQGYTAAEGDLALIVPDANQKYVFDFYRSTGFELRQVRYNPTASTPLAQDLDPIELSGGVDEALQQFALTT